MKDLKNLAGILSLCLIVSCHKNPLEDISRGNASTIVPGQQKSIMESDWTSPLKWNSAEQPTHSVYYSNIPANVSAAAADQGLVLVFKMDNPGNGSAPKALPFEENNNSQKTYWYYEVNDGNIMVSVDVYGSRSNPVANSSFKYVVLDNTALQDMEKTGNSKKELMQMSYNDWNKLNK